MKRQKQTGLVKTICVILLVFMQSLAFITAFGSEAGAQVSRTEEMDFNIPAQLGIFE